MASGDTKTEALLNILGHGGTGDEYRGSGNTKTQNYILDAVDRINAIAQGGGGGGGSDSPIKVLTDADVNFDDDGDGTNETIACWLLPEGWYLVGEDTVDENNDCIVKNYLYGRLNRGDLIRITANGDSILSIGSYGFFYEAAVDHTTGELTSGMEDDDELFPYQCSVSDISNFIHGQ